MEEERVKILPASYPCKSVKNHPLFPGRFTAEIHRIVVAEREGRILRTDEHVHHKDEDPTNFASENLELLPRKDHYRLHHLGKKRPSVSAKMRGRKHTPEAIAKMKAAAARSIEKRRENGRKYGRLAGLKTKGRKMSDEVRKRQSERCKREQTHLRFRKEKPMRLSLEDALVVLSGGQDSTTALFWAKERYQKVHAVTFNYGQRHAIEIESAKKVAQMAGVASHEVVEVGPLLKGTSPLVSENPVGRYENPDQLPGGVEPTFVPGRNLLFLVLAANRACALGAAHVVTGVCEEDYGGYPDCRQSFISEMEEAINSGFFGTAVGDKVGSHIIIETPLMWLKKRETVQMATELPGCMEALAHSHTCYAGQYPPDPHNHASILRAKGFHEAGVADPLITRAKSEGLLPADYPDDGYVYGTPFASAELVSD